jgi:hypothetical protein
MKRLTEMLDKEYLAFDDFDLAKKEYKKHKAPCRLIDSPHIDNKNGRFFVEWGKRAFGMVRSFEKVILENI